MSLSATPALAPPKISTQASLLLRRDAALYKRFTQLYKQKRLRHDDVLAQLEQEFFITQRTIRTLLKQAPQQLPPEQPVEHDASLQPADA